MLRNTAIEQKHARRLSLAQLVRAVSYSSRVSCVWWMKKRFAAMQNAWVFGLLLQCGCCSFSLKVSCNAIMSVGFYPLPTSNRSM